MATAPIWYGGVQIVLGLIVAIPSMTVGVPGTTIALCVSLFLTGIYAVLGSGYLKSSKDLIRRQLAYPDQPVLLRTLTPERYIEIHIQFLKLYIIASVLLVLLGLASFVEGTLVYFTTTSYADNDGTTPAIAGIAALLINIFIGGYCFADIRRLRSSDGRALFETPPQPAVDPSRLQVSTIEVTRAGFPPSYSRIELDPKIEDLPPSYYESLAGSSVTLLTTDELPGFVFPVATVTGEEPEEPASDPQGTIGSPVQNLEDATVITVPTTEEPTDSSSGDVSDGTLPQDLAQ